MTRRVALCAALAGLVVLGGCGSTPEAERAPPTQRQSLDRSARLAFEQARYPQAATLYEAALRAALAEDDPTAIIDARFNLALCQTYVGQYEAALAQIAQADAERVRRGLPVDPDLQLLAGTIRYRAGDAELSEATLEALLQGGTATAPTRAKAHFVAGLIAADRGATGALRTRIAALSVDANDSARSDRFELQARLAGLEGDVDGALGLLDQVVVSRRLERDYRGMVRALATAGGLAEGASRLQQAGDYFLRAGRSAAQRAEPEAREWLVRAKTLGERSGDSALVLEAEGSLATMKASD